MIDTLKVGKVIFDKLDEIPELQHRIYPLIAENNTIFPFVIYTRTSLTGLMCKDGLYEDEVIMSIEIVTDNYGDGIDIAQIVREKLTFRTQKMTSALSGAHEEFASDAYIQTLEFLIKVNN